MAKGTNTARIGAFVLIGILLVVAAIAIFGGGRLFRESRQVVMNFTASMQGLGRGSPVMFSGVPIGEVTDIILRLNETTLAYDSTVLVNLHPDRFERADPSEGHEHPVIEKLISKGLRARLVPISIITGQLGIELGFYPETPARLTGGHPGIIEVPTIPSTVERLETTLQKILTVLEAADLKEISTDVERTLQSISTLMTMPELRETIVDTATAAKDLRLLLTQLRSETQPLLGSLRGMSRGAENLIGDAQRTLPALRAEVEKLGPALVKIDALAATADDLLRNLNGLILPGSPLQLQLASTLRDLSRTSASLRSLATALEDNPNSILFGGMRGASE